jgi:hypothetical protein
VPIFSDAWSKLTLEYIGLPGSVSYVNVPEDPLIVVAEEQELLVLHLRMFVSHMGHMLFFGLLYQSAPWSWCRYIEGNPRSIPVVLDEMRRFWRVVLSLEASEDKVLQGLSKRLLFKASV